MLLVVVFNVCFCAPILILLGAVVAGGERGRAFAQAARSVIQRYAATIVPVLLGLLGAGILMVGLVGSARRLTLPISAALASIALLAPTARRRQPG